MSSTFGRGFKHVSRFVSKPFVGANRDNLTELEKLLSAIHQNPGVLYNCQPNLFAFGRYKFTWLLNLEPLEFQAMNGDWIAHLQSFAASQTRLPATTMNSATRQVLFRTADADFWKGLQNIKDRHKAISSKNSTGFFTRLLEWTHSNRVIIDDWKHHNKYFGYYATQYDNTNVIYKDCQESGAENDTERQILALKGLWRVCKSAYTVAKGSLRIAVGDASQVRTVVKNSVKMLNNLGGLIAGIADMAQSHEADFRRLSTRWGLEQQVEALKQKYLGPGEQGTLLEQTVAGPQRLEKKADLILKELDELRDAVKHSQWWCENWKLDILEIEKDLGKDDYIHDLSRRLSILREKGSTITPLEIGELSTTEKINRDVLREELTKLKDQVSKFDYFLNERLRKLNNLLAAYDTRRSIAKTQKNLASAGVVYDAPRQLALEISAYDKSKLLLAPGPGLTPPPETIGTLRPPLLQESAVGADLSMGEIMATAMRRRREYISPEDD